MKSHDLDCGHTYGQGEGEAPVAALPLAPVAVTSGSSEISLPFDSFRTMVAGLRAACATFDTLDITGSRVSLANAALIVGEGALEDFVRKPTTDTATGAQGDSPEPPQ